ncbi:MAG: hypothetical protein CM15mP63_3040 [Gammaproteobacteria bacterium]|nr:MAG: hypothetical protein CM15mP63_3040 [Gammaproteobacteria bacterium]
MNTNHDKCMLLRYRISQDICDWKSLEHHEEKIDSYIGNGEEHPFLNISRTKNEEINLSCKNMVCKKYYESLKT